MLSKLCLNKECCINTWIVNGLLSVHANELTDRVVQKLSYIIIKFLMHWSQNERTERPPCCSFLLPISFELAPPCCVATGLLGLVLLSMNPPTEVTHASVSLHITWLLASRELT